MGDVMRSGSSISAVTLGLAIALGTPFAAGSVRAEAPDEFPSLEAAIKARNLTYTDGLFTIYRDPKTGTGYIAVRADQMGKEIIHSAYIENGVAELNSGRLARGAKLVNEILRLERSRNTLRVMVETPAYYFDPASPLAKSRGANIPPVVAAEAPILAATPGNGSMLVKLQDFLPDLGADNAKFDIFEVRNHPANTNVAIDYSVSTSAGASPLRVQHTLIVLKGSDYAPRAADYRVGYFTEKITDLSSAAPAPYRDLVRRWNLKKKDPNAALSEPVQPIIFWIENTAPMEFRGAVKAGVLAWNKAFEQAGFRGAIEARDQPDNADCHVGDIRCNVIRWVSTNSLGYLGITPSYTNPRTGEIISANVILDYATLIRSARGFQGIAAADMPPTSITKLAQDRLGQELCCSYTGFVGSNLHFGLATISPGSGAAPEMERLTHELVQWTVMHEVGHALGLRHNFKGSTIRPLSELQAANRARYPLTGSVMDYLPINLARPGERQGAFFPTEIGPYDAWAIQFGYAPSLPDPAAEASRASTLLQRSTEPQLIFGDDGDSNAAADGAEPDAADLTPSTNVDPRDATWDLSADPVAWAKGRLGLINATLSGLRARYVKPGQSYAALQEAYSSLIQLKGRAALALSRAIGGIYIDNALPGQPQAKAPFTPVPASTQKSAMAGLAQFLFAPDAFALPAELASSLKVQPRGAGTSDPQIHQTALQIQSLILSRILNDGVFARLKDSGLYGNTYSAMDVCSDLTAAIFSVDAEGDINSFRRELQAEYVRQLIYGYTSDKPSAIVDASANSAVLAQLSAISAMTRPRWFLKKSPETEAHRAYLHQMIDHALRADR